MPPDIPLQDFHLKNVASLIMSFRLTLTTLIFSFLLSFNALAVSLLEMERCMIEPTPAMEGHEDCAGAQEDNLLQSAAQLLCETGSDCQIGGAVLGSATALFLQQPPRSDHFTLLIPHSPLRFQSFWRPPRS